MTATATSTAQDNEVSSGHTSGTSGTSISYDNADHNTAATSTLAQTCGGAETLTQSFSGSTGSLNADGQVTEDSEAYSGSCSGQTGYERNYTYGPNGWVIYQGSVVQGANPYNILYNPGSVATEISSHDSSGYFDTYDQTFNSTAAVTTQTPVSGSHGVSSDLRLRHSRSFVELDERYERDGLLLRLDRPDDGPHQLHGHGRLSVHRRRARSRLGGSARLGNAGQH